uniref:Uncharacterized protein n=1 Tax=Oryza meridionalis TaxID=40149 RepID=A0A0E0DZ39_9ORYZ
MHIYHQGGPHTSFPHGVDNLPDGLIAELNKTSLASIRTGESLISFLTTNLKFKKTSIHLVHSEDRPNPLTKGLAKHSFSSNADTLNTVNHNQNAISYTKCGCDFRRKIDVSR